jgi:AcrR family transcriptional regulator
MLQDDGMATVTMSARERARAEITREILEVSRDHLARDGAAALSLRAVARDLGMVSSAIYRYVPNRDALLTLLIVSAYDAVGAAAEQAEAAVARDDLLGRFLATCHALRGWAHEHPHEYALIYGSPVPGYAAPVDTVAPASRVPTVLVGILVDMTSAGAAPEPAPVPQAVARSVRPVLTTLAESLDADLMLRGLASWSTLLGAVSLELFGHLHNVVDDAPKARRAYFDHQMRQAATTLGLA